MEQFTKAVQIISFSIGDVPGFKALSTVGTKPIKRMLSAIAIINKTLVNQRDQLGYGYPSKVELFNEKISLSSGLLTGRLVERFSDILVVNGIVELTTEELIAQDNCEIYKNNYACFRENFEEIKEFVKSRNDLIKPTPPVVEIDPKENIPILFLCKGNVFGENHFALYMTMSDAKDVGGDYKLAVKHFCHAVLTSRKNYFVSKLGIGDSDTAAIAHNLRRIDGFISTINYLDVVEIGYVFSRNCTMHLPTKNVEPIGKLTNTLMLEAEKRLYEYLETLFN